MKKFIKSVVKGILKFGAVLGVALMTAEDENISMQFLWTMSWAGEMALCVWGLMKLFPEEFKEDKR